MGNYVEGNDRIAFHPGYYVEEILEDSGLTHEDFAKRLGVTPESLSLLVCGEQRLSAEMAERLSGMLGTGIQYWINLQNAYDAVLAGVVHGLDGSQVSRCGTKDTSLMESICLFYWRKAG